MTSNPYRPQYTEVQRRRVESAREQLLEHWNKNVRNGQPAMFRVWFEREMLESGRLVDEFSASPASPSFSAEWRREVARLGDHCVVEHGACSFKVFVSHAHYLQTGVVPVSVDAACLTTTTVQVMAALVCFYVAVYLYVMSAQ